MARSEIFEEDGLECLIENKFINKDDVKVNQNISDDIEILQIHYTILLEYIDDLEAKLRNEHKKQMALKREISFLKKNNNPSENENEMIKQLKCSNASLKGVVARKDKELEQNKLLLLEGMKELDDLKKFKQDVIMYMNKNGG